MRSSALGKNTFPVEITITQFGLWLHLHSEEFFLPYDEYPFFKEATLNDIYSVELHHKTHLFWPELDIDLSTEILKNPHHFPLIAKKKK